MSSNLSHRVEVAKEALLRGSEALLKYFPLTAEQVKTIHKKDRTPRTLIDLEVQQKILEYVVASDAFDDYVIHAEEEPETDPEKGGEPLPEGLEYRADLEGFVVHSGKTRGRVELGKK